MSQRRRSTVIIKHSESLLLLNVLIWVDLVEKGRERAPLIHHKLLYLRYQWRLISLFIEGKEVNAQYAKEG